MWLVRIVFCKKKIVMINISYSHVAVGYMFINMRITRLFHGGVLELDVLER